MQDEPPATGTTDEQPQTARARRTVKLISEDDIFARWNTRAGHNDNGQWVVDDAPGERTGPPGKWHWASHETRSACGQQLAKLGDLTMSAVADPAEMCHNCLRVLMKPWLG